MKVLVTGGTGFLGRHVVWRFAASGANVVFTGRNAAAAKEVMQFAEGPVRWVALAHGKPDAAALAASAARDADIVVHCAAMSAPWGSPEAFYKANVASTAEVLAACHECKVPRLVHISTPSIYFDFQDRLNIREDASLPSPVNEYARTKSLAEDLVRGDPPPETVILRPRALFGPWDRTLMPRLLRVMRQGPLPIMRGGAIQVDLTYIDNVVDAVQLAATKALPRSPVTYNVSNGEPQALMTLLETLAREFAIPLRTRKLPWPMIKLAATGLETAARIGNGKEPILTRYSAGVLAFSQTLDIRALRDELGYRPGVSINEGIRRHASWWRAQPDQIRQ
jgi:nucleoside-diphosphate-sugar epimerase